MPGIFGFSVQHQIGLTLEQLAAAGRFRNAHISYATESELIRIAKDLGYDLSITKTPGVGYHHTMVARSMLTGVMLWKLPDELAMALSSVFKHMTNPARVD